MRRCCCALIAFTLFVHLPPPIARAEPHLRDQKCHFALVYLNDESAANEFKELLTESNCATDLVPLDVVTSTDWAKYSAVIVASDIDRAWTSSAAKCIADAKVPVLGLGEGGYYFFGKLNLGIGSPNGYHGAEVGVRAASPLNTPYWTSATLSKSDSGEQLLYSSSSHVAIHLPGLRGEVVPLGYELKNNAYAPILEQNGHYLLWGFTESPRKMTPLGKRLFVHTCCYLAKTKHAQGDETNAPASPFRVAFIYLRDDDSTKSFKQLLVSNGFAIDLISIDDVPTTDFSSYQALIAGPDIERAWSSQAAAKIAEAKKPVLGLGEGGSALFEKLHLDIGWMHTYHGGEVGVRAASPENAYWSSAGPSVKASDEQMLYSSTGHVAVHLSDLSPDVIPLGYELKNRSYAPIIEQDRRYLLWGFRESPLKMTTLGKQLFVHTCRYVANGLASVRPDEQAAATDTSNRHNQASLTRRVEALEAKVAELDGLVGAAKAGAADRAPSDADETANPLQGTWVNVDSPAHSVTKLLIEKGDGSWTARAFGACEPTDCDWGATELHLLSDSVSSRRISYGFARWDHGFAEVNAALVLDGEHLMLVLFEIFKDNSGRSNFRSTVRLRRENAAVEVKASETYHKDQRPGADAPEAAAQQLHPAGSVINLTEAMDGGSAVTADNSLALYFAFGPVDGAKSLVQVGWDGTVHGSLELPYSISGLAPDRDRLVATVVSSRVGDGRVIAIGNSGLLTEVFRDPDLLPDTIHVWCTAESKEILVADNGADVVVSLSKDRKSPARMLLEIEGHPDFQDMSIAKCPDGNLLYSGSDLRAVYRVAPGEGPTLHNPLMQGYATVCADPSSTKWVAAMADQLHFFEGNQLVKSFPYPAGRSMTRHSLAFSNSEQLIIGLEAGQQLWIYAVDVGTGEFHGLFKLRSDRVTGFAIAPKMTW